jgi:serine/threonine-protein kinase
MSAKVNTQALNADGAPSGHRRVDDDRVYLAAGDVVANKYRVERILGVGGVGFVVAATHVELGGLFALKFLKRPFLNDKAIAERFTREARAACRISSEYVARVYDVGSHEGAPFIVLEHLVGRDLSAVLAERRTLGLRESAEYGVQACAALAVAHANGIVHRDIKPENLFVVDEQGLPTVKLLDFGISKFVTVVGQPANEWAWEEEPITGALTCGTPDYMSPEQIQSTASVDGRSDIWSLGMVLYELLASTPAFQAESVMDTCSAILDTQPRRLDAVRPEVPPEFADIIARCLQKDPADRFATVAELAVALLPFASARALAIAENSEWIRRAAIQTVGGSSTEARISSSNSIVSSASRPNLAPPVVSSPSLLATRTPSRRRFGAALAVAMSIAGVGAYSWIGGHSRAAEGLESPARIAASSPLAGTVPTTSPVDEPSASRGPLPEAIPLGSSAAPMRAATPSNARATRTSPRAPASSKAASSPASSFSSAAPSTRAPLPQPSAWQAVSAPPIRTVRAIDSSNPWSPTL